MVMNEFTTKALYESSLMELIIILQSGDIDSPEEKFYLQTLISYFSGNVNFLARISSNSVSLPKINLNSLALFRQKIFFKQVEKNDIEKMKLTLSHIGIWQGEVFNLMARTCENLGQEASAVQFYNLAKRHAHKHNFIKKSLLMEMNAIAAESRIKGGIDSLLMYFNVAAKAERAKYPLVQAIALMNVSRELGEVGAFRLSLKYCNLALSQMQENIGSQPYFLLIACKAWVLLALKRMTEFTHELQMLNLSTHRDIQKLAIDLENEKKCKSFCLYWKNNSVIKNTLSPIPSLSPFEENLIQLLLTENYSSKDLEFKLWHNRIDSEYTNQRLKRLLARLRKKQPHLVLFDSGSYRLNFLRG